MTHENDCNSNYLLLIININIYQGNSTEVLASNESGIFQY